MQAETAKAVASAAEQKPELMKEREPEAELSPQKIIEATLPKVCSLTGSVLMSSIKLNRMPRVPSAPDHHRIWKSERNSSSYSCLTAACDAAHA